MECAASPTSAKRSLQYWRACVEPQREVPARRRDLDFAQRAVERAVRSLRDASSGGQRREAFRVFGARRPHDRAATVRQRQERDRAVGEEALPRSARMRMLGAHVGHECALIVVPSCRLDARRACG